MASRRFAALLTVALIGSQSGVTGAAAPRAADDFVLAEAAPVQYARESASASAVEQSLRCKLQAVPESVSLGEPIQLKWSSTGAVAAVLRDGRSFVSERLAPTGSIVLDSTHSQGPGVTYQLTVSARGGATSNCVAQVAVSRSGNCLLDGVVVVDGRSRKFYNARTVSKGGSCSAQAVERSCRNGALEKSAAYRFADCKVLEEFTGVNVNENPEHLDPKLVQRANARWFRSFVEILEQKRRGEKERANAQAVADSWRAFKSAAAGSERKAILNLKWSFDRFGMRPPVPGSAEEKELFDYLDTHILADLAPHADIIVTGNEPFLETGKLDWKFSAAHGGIPNALFYERVTRHVHEYLVEAGMRDRIALYVGAFTRLHAKEMQSQAAVQQLLRYAEATPYVDGIDIHTHVERLQEMTAALEFVQSQTAKPIIVTEYTFVRAANRAIDSGDRLGQPFARNWGLDAGMTVEKYLGCRVFQRGQGCRARDKITKEEWYDFFRTRDWYIDHFILKADRIFRAHNVNGSTFGLMQKTPTDAQLSREGTPWYLGFLFSAAAVRHEPDGSPAPNYQYLDDFLQLQARDRAP